MNDPQSEWDFYTTTTEGHPAHIALDFAYADEAPLDEYPWLFWISVKLNAADADGLPGGEEQKMLEQLTERLAENLDIIDALHVATVTCDSHADYYFYGAATDQFEDTVEEVMEQFPDYAFATDVSKDKNWDEYLGSLYPGYYDYQCMLNRRLMDDLRDEGDNPAISRPIEHYLRFQTLKDRETFVTAIRQLDFSAPATHLPAERGVELPFPLQISKSDTTLADPLNAAIWQLCQLAEKHNGLYEGWSCDAVAAAGRSIE